MGLLRTGPRHRTAFFVSPGNVYLSILYVLAVGSLIPYRLFRDVGSSTSAQVAADAVTLAVALVLLWIQTVSQYQSMVSFTILITTALGISLLSLLNNTLSDTPVFLYCELNCTLCLAVFHLEANSPLLRHSMHVSLAVLIALVAVVYSVSIIGTSSPLFVFLAGPLTTGSLLALVGTGVHKSCERANTMQYEISNMNTAVQSALAVFFSAVPKATRHYVTQSKSPSLAVLEVAEAQTVLGQGALSSTHNTPVTTPNPTPGPSPLAPRRHALPLLPTIPDSEDTCTTEGGGEPLVPAGDRQMSVILPTTSTAGSVPSSVRHGLITAEHDCVVAFIGVTTKWGSVPTAAYIRDLSILMCLIDDVIAETQGMQKVKACDGCVIVRQAGKVQAGPKDSLDEQ
ncbi:hypothetical protein KIPB_010643, partial [Kipferlia bialata]|eukprot:g10643.t1